MQTNILITGASRGIGAAIADALTTDATKVVALSSADGDLSDPATPDRLWQASLDKLDGRIDVLVNNAGVFESNPMGGSNADWLADGNRPMQVNLTAADRRSVGQGKRECVRVDLRGRRWTKKTQHRIKTSR